jgi:DHA1 family bicyclomycin/chloramphenicol resistance-like MFS transporter
MNISHTNKNLNIEFIAIMALLMSLVALSIDGILPALPEIGASFGVVDSQSHQLLITMIFLGLGIGQLIFGPLSDAYGRKPLVFIGFVVFTVASIVCVLTDRFEIMIIGRIVQGIGLASPRTLSIAMVRDSFEGDYMAKIMSFIVMIFIIVPVVAPTLGQYILLNYDWKSIFNVQLGFGVLVLFWFWKRQSETLRPINRKPLKLSLFREGCVTFFKQPQAVAFTLISGLITGSFMVYLSTTQQIFEQQYNRADDFPMIFASLAIGVGLSTYLNGILVENYGMKRMAFVSLIAYTLTAFVYVMLFFQSNNPSLAVVLVFFALQFSALGFLFGNLRALAMQPIGHIAGIGAALNGFLSTVMAVPIATWIGSFVQTEVWPLFFGFLSCGAMSLIIFLNTNPLERTL